MLCVSDALQIDIGRSRRINVKVVSLLVPMKNFILVSVIGKSTIFSEEFKRFHFGGQ